jgi:hypothetical protein
MSGSSPLLQAARLWERTSTRGTTYMSGRLGGVKIVIMPSRDFAADDPANSDGSTSAPRPATAERAPAEKREPRPRQAARGGPIDDDPVPFRNPETTEIRV